ncbi:hypothetical protein BLNAU_1116 [Blattamonas nauphoetae]|uniref:10 kDa chaperonin n=1 Tax=Blattamonas nauphoetae TaxID=2049346 RepID=A0ABQ9YJU4_9EUKA|nr:hypothetical protein BLNAU_1116 [Blattamonas nauphoetae]
MEKSQKPNDKVLLTPRYQGRNSILADEMGLGKAQPLTAKVLTPTGWVTMGELKEGDEVIAAMTGKATKMERQNHYQDELIVFEHSSVINA